MIIDAVVTLGTNEVEATSTNDISVTVTLNDTIENPSATFCEKVDECLGISPNGDESKYLNEKGEFLTVTDGGGIQSVVAGNNISVDDSDPLNPIVSADDITSTDVTNALGYTPESVSNKSTNVLLDKNSNTKYPTVKSVYDWVSINFTTAIDVSNAISAALAGYATQAWVNSQGFITNVITALGYTPENTANKTGTVAGNETSTTLFPTLNGITSWIKNTLSTWVGAHGSAVVDADTILIGKSGVLGTRTWAQIKSTLFTWVDYSAITTIVGWSSFSDKRVQYIQIGNYVFYDIYVGGTSNSATTSITIAHTISERILFSNYGNNNGTVSTNRLNSTVGSNVLTFDTMNSTTSVTSLSSSNTKLINFQFIIKV